MRSVESEGDSIDQAIESALRTLGVSRDLVQVEILADATRGVFGFGGTKARVRATLREALSPGDIPRVIGDGVSRETRVPGETVSRETSRPVQIDDQLSERSREVLTGLLSHVGVSCTVRMGDTSEADTIHLEVTGDSSGLLIGRRGQTLDALEYLVNRMSVRGDNAVARISVDVEGYRQRRREYLETLARRLADKAKQSGRVVTLNPMSPRDRRIVHLALQDDQAVSTRSQGDGHFRKVLILPENRQHRTSRSAG
jgi:spoIIIJ-associated protein